MVDPAKNNNAIYQSRTTKKPGKPTDIRIEKKVPEGNIHPGAFNEVPSAC